MHALSTNMVSSTPTFRRQSQQLAAGSKARIQLLTSLRVRFVQAASERYVIDIAGLADDTDVDPEPKIDPSKWRVHDSATIVPAECRASAHAK